MTDTDEKKNTQTTEATTSQTDTPSATATAPRRDAQKQDDKSRPQRPRRELKKNTRSRRRRRDRDEKKSDVDQKIISIRRVTRVMAGGRRFSFSVAIVVGDRKGSVGVGTGKATDTALAIEKAARDAKKNMIKLPLDEEMRIPHEVSAKYSSSEVWISPAPGKGLVAGSSVRTVLELAGVRDVTAKLLTRSKNRLNNAQAAIRALKQLKA